MSLPPCADSCAPHQLFQRHLHSRGEEDLLDALGAIRQAAIKRRLDELYRGVRSERLSERHFIQGFRGHKPYSRALRRASGVLAKTPACTRFQAGYTVSKGVRFIYYLALRLRPGMGKYKGFLEGPGAASASSASS